MLRIVFIFLLYCPTIQSLINIPTRTIAPGVDIPVISIGTWSEGTKEDPTKIVDAWMRLGGRGVDTAYIYFDQAKVASAIAGAGVQRKDVFLTTKIPGCELVSTFVKKDLQQLNTSYLDLVLIHAPLGSSGMCSGAWKTLEQYVSDGKIRSIGVSNFKEKNLEPLLKVATIVPAVNQIDHNVFDHDDATVNFCQQHNITVEAYSPLGSPGRSKSARSVFSDPTVTKIAHVHNVSQAQVALRWIVQSGHILTFLSENPQHQANDADVFGFSLTAAEMKELSSIQ
jgi:diketogulonate reductase-like aldo/keto reductase